MTCFSLARTSQTLLAGALAAFAVSHDAQPGARLEQRVLHLVAGAAAEVEGFLVVPRVGRVVDESDALARGVVVLLVRDEIAEHVVREADEEDVPCAATGSPW